MGSKNKAGFSEVMNEVSKKQEAKKESFAGNLPNIQVGKLSAGDQSKN
tara:strand:- start:1862 stop:2005 length:144 start_codon:yes stop_codon:yes gene_type:complete